MKFLYRMADRVADVLIPVSYAAPGHRLRTHLWSPPRAHGENYRFWDDYGALAGRDAVFVTKRKVERRVPGLKRYFSDVAEPEILPIHVRGGEVRRFFIVRCRGFSGEEPVL